MNKSLKIQSIFFLDMMTMDPLLTVGTPQGIMIVEATVTARGRGHLATVTTTMAAGMKNHAVFMHRT